MGIRVMLLEHETTLRQGLRALLDLRPGVRVVGEAGDIENALASIPSRDPSVFVTGIGPCGQFGMNLANALNELKCPLPVLVLSDVQSDDSLRAGLHAGVSGFVLKESPPAELIEGLKAVSTGKKFFCATLSKKLLQRLAHTKKQDDLPTPLQRLTRRERDVLRRIALGHANKVVASALGLSVKTVEKHRSNLMRKLDLHNAAGVTMFALRHGVVTGDVPPPSTDR